MNHKITLDAKNHDVVNQITDIKNHFQISNIYIKIKC